jgi:hypothetical protein
LGCDPRYQAPFPQRRLLVPETGCCAVPSMHILHTRVFLSPNGTPSQSSPTAFIVSYWDTVTNTASMASDTGSVSSPSKMRIILHPTPPLALTKIARAVLMNAFSALHLVPKLVFSAEPFPLILAIRSRSFPHTILSIA